MSIAGFSPGARTLAAILALAGAGALGGCFRANRPAPVDRDTVWPVLLEESTRSPFEDETVPASPPERVWQSDPHRGFAASPAVSGQALISVSTNRMVQALSMEDGEIFWEHRKNGPLTVPPVIAGQRIFIATSDVEGVVYGLRLRDGRDRWDRDQPGVELPMVVDGDRLILANVAGQVRAVSVESGNTLWRTRVGHMASGPITVGERIVVATDTDSLVALDRREGGIVDRRGLPDQPSAPPALREGILYIPLHSGDLMAIRASDLSEVWRVRTGPPVLAAPAVSGDGTIYLLDRTGGVWTLGPEGDLRRIARLGGVARRSLTLTRNALLVGLLDGTFAAVDRTSGEILWTLKFHDSIYTPAVVHEGAVYVPLRRGELVKLR